jgi:hypothetical protein
MEQKTIAPARQHITLKGELWGITTFFNPAGYLNKIRHLEIFCEGARSQGLKLLVVEAAYNDEPFAVGDKAAEIVIRVRPRDILWQKERLLNVGLDHLPPTCDKVAWLDADILLENAGWARETSKLLEEYAVVQPFDVAWSLPPGRYDPPADFSGGGFAEIAHGLAFLHAQAEWPPNELGRSGLAWAARRSLLAKHGFYDRMVIGGGDTVLCWGMYDQRFRRPIGELSGRFCSPAQIADVARWKASFHADVQGSITFLSGRVFHLWHGARKDRRLTERQLVLKEANFDPRGDIAIDGQGCWQWSSEKPELHKKVKEYFHSRNEGEIRRTEHAAA